MTIFASTPATGSARLKGRGYYLAAGVGYDRLHGPNPALLDFRQLHGEKRGDGLILPWTNQHRSGDPS